LAYIGETLRGIQNPSSLFKLTKHDVVLGEADASIRQGEVVSEDVL
jgi:hypothetical protein